ncbi:signal peptide containing protein [Theileria equi strain WA]|uniref:Signal peptide containing protein n=1 Tax=Theileria equi strain WA TaxID=1537102 RepID=L1L9M7_THEEQ|nr:signal peptide containing protein [Theileria equi strain WA]EKX72201.1 signal peptide containing protein [Theileria equi strain WA]|eukprot:XP_004831653.1 signal peptide containing protein [Theileria equi strain WA]
MNVLAVLWTVYLLGLCNCREPSSLRKEVVDLVFDLSFPDSSLVRYYESTADGVVYQSFFPKGQLFSKVVDGGATLWEAKGEERCDVLFSNVGDRTRAVLHVWANGIDSKMMHYEKLDGEWKLETVRVKGRPVSEKPAESNDELNFSSLGCPLGGSSGSEVEDEESTKSEPSLGDTDKAPKDAQPEEVSKEFPEEDSGYVESSVVVPPKHADEEPKTSDIEVVNNTDKPDALPESIVEDDVKDSEPVEDEASTEAPQDVSANDGEPTTTTPVTLDLATPDKSKLDVHTETESGVPLKTYSPKDGYITSVVENGAPIWTFSENEKCLFVASYAKDGVTIIRLGTSDESSGTKSKHFEKVNGTWSGIDINAFDKKIEEMMGESSGPEEPLNPLFAKLDTSLFNVEDSVEDAVKVLKLEAKAGVTANKLTYGEDKVWEDKKKTCSSALLYMDGEKAILAIVDVQDTKNGNKKVYQYLDGSKWKNHKEGKHKSKLEALKKKCESKPEKTQETPQSTGRADGSAPSGHSGNKKNKGSQSTKQTNYLPRTYRIVICA